jgi:hypothetical protein
MASSLLLMQETINNLLHSTFDRNVFLRMLSNTDAQFSMKYLVHSHTGVPKQRTNIVHFSAEPLPLCIYLQNMLVVTFK